MAVIVLELISLVGVFIKSYSEWEPKHAENKRLEQQLAADAKNKQPEAQVPVDVNKKQPSAANPCPRTITMINSQSYGNGRNGFTVGDSDCVTIKGSRIHHNRKDGVAVVGGKQ